MVAARPVPLTENAEVERTRKILLIILSVCLVGVLLLSKRDVFPSMSRALSMLGAISGIVDSSVQDQANGTRRNSQIGENVIAVLFYAFGILLRSFSLPFSV
jgi:uncharacterized YccA/Bax inhibitor family protein